jgi:hypothetical protein
MPIGNPRWLPPQVIVLTQDHIGKIGGGHLGYPIGIKNTHLVEDLPMIIPGQFGSETTNMIKAKLYMNVH